MASIAARAYYLNKQIIFKSVLLNDWRTWWPHSDAGGINFHIVSMIPTNRNFLNSSHELGKALKEKKFNLRTVPQL